MSSRRTFTSEYKRECAELVIKQGYQVKEAAQAMNVGLSSLQKWLRQYRNEMDGITPKAAAITAEQKRIQELEAQVKQLKRDKDLLKKASAFFAMEMHSTSK
jgi:transposase